ncbi:hypothetical protein APICC_08437 [Apis cerana cerana]|uniref:Uncharacterized protein n=1 Tax=Apis cerana cerana TaxID=94128 RepID=A0A2A3E094_APICC|nr:hypothetical protein APICC_08437 [Apis cerana cerana]
MPMEFLDRLPIPNLRVYTAISFAVLSCSVYYAVQIIKDPAWKSNHTYVETESESANNIESDPRNLAMHLKELLECMLDEPICIWISNKEKNIIVLQKNICSDIKQNYAVKTITFLREEFG